MNSGIRISLILLILLISSTALSSQQLSKKQLIKAVQDADNLFYYDEDFDKAARQPVNMKEFEGVEGIRKIYSKDGYYRYVTGEFSSFKKTRTALASYLESKYKDAFIRELNFLLIK